MTKIVLSGLIGDIAWHIEDRGAAFLFKAFREDEEIAEIIRKRPMKKIADNLSTFEKLLDLVIEDYFDSVDFEAPLIDLLDGIKNVGDKELSFLKEQTDVRRKFTFIKIYAKYLNLTFAEMDRLYSVLRLSNLQADIIYYTLPGLGGIKNWGPTEQLDLIDFIANGDGDEKFEEFRADNAGRSFPVLYTLDPKTSSRYTYGNNYVNRSEWLSLLETIPKLYMKSGKVKEVLSEFTLEELRAKYAFLPSTTLTVPDTVAVINSLKSFELNVSEERNLSWDRRRALGNFGQEWTEAFHEAEVYEIFEYYLYNQNLLHLNDSRKDIAVILVHLIEKLGLKGAGEVLTTVRNETDGVSRHGLITIANNGGFSKEYPPSWEVVLLG